MALPIANSVITGAISWFTLATRCRLLIEALGDTTNKYGRIFFYAELDC
jgi:hypothetical protein